MPREAALGEPDGPGRNVATRVLAVLDAFRGNPDRLTLSEVAERTGLPVSTTYRMLAVLTDWGALERGPDNRYQVGIWTWEVGQHAVRELADVARPFLQDLFEVTRENVHLCVRSGADTLYLQRFYGSKRVPLMARIGGRLPLHATAAGKVLLAFEEKWFRDAYLAGTLERRTAFTITEPARLARELATVRRRGYGVTSEEIRLGTCSIAVPVSGPDGTVVASIGVVIDSSRAATIARMLPPLLGTARRIEAALRVPGPVPSRGPRP
jgi:DNA-binding IclR family transcriptional regulator